VEGKRRNVGAAMEACRLQRIICLPGAARRLVTFSCAAKEKVTKEKAAQVRRPDLLSSGVPCAARQAGRLRNSHRTLEQSSTKSPGLSATARRLSWVRKSA